MTDRFFQELASRTAEAYLTANATRSIPNSKQEDTSSQAQQQNWQNHLVDVKILILTGNLFLVRKKPNFFELQEENWGLPGQTPPGL